MKNIVALSAALAFMSCTSGAPAYADPPENVSQAAQEILLLEPYFEHGALLFEDGTYSAVTTGGSDSIPSWALFFDITEEESRKIVGSIHSHPNISLRYGRNPEVWKKNNIENDLVNQSPSPSDYNFGTGLCFIREGLGGEPIDSMSVWIIGPDRVLREFSAPCAPTKEE